MVNSIVFEFGKCFGCINVGLHVFSIPISTGFFAAGITQLTGFAYALHSLNGFAYAVDKKISVNKV